MSSDASLLRNKIILQRQSIPPQEKSEKNSIIAQYLLDCSLFKNARTVLFYMPIRNEVDVQKVMYHALEEGKKVILPRTDLHRKTMTLHAITGNYADLILGHWNIPEPADHCAMVLPKELDLVLVPGIAFDTAGNRLGYGRGFYDRLLQRLSVPTIGLAYEFQVLPKIKKEPHDVALNLIITEERIIQCPAKM